MPAEVVDPEGGVTAFTVSNGLVTEIVDPDGVRVRFEHDRDGAAVAAIDGDGNATRVQRDAQGRVIATISPLGRRTELEHDEHGRIVARRDPSGGVWRYEHTSGGRLSAVIDPDGAREEIRYGEHGKPVETIDALGHATTERHDIFGNVVEATDRACATTRYEYDALMRLTTIVDALGGNWDREHYADGNLVATVDPAGTRRARTFDPAGRITAVHDGLAQTAYAFDELGHEPGPVKLYPALAVEPEATVAEFDAQHPEGADYVIVPAMSRDDDPVVLQWLKSQASRGAMIVGVCAGAMVVGEAGLLDGKRATTHWYFVEELLEKHPAVHYVPDRRLVVDQGVTTTTGITASMPVSLTLIEAIAGREKAEAVGRDLGVTWDARHDSDAFQFTRPFAMTAIVNTVAFWNREQLGLELTPGVDEVSLALVADAWSRTYRSRAVTFSRTAGAQQTRNGMRIVPDQVAASWPVEHLLPAISDRRPARALDEALQGIGTRYGTRTADFVATQLEYPRPSGSQ